MADNAGEDSKTEQLEETITFNVKASSNQTYALSFPTTSTVRDVKEKLATAEYANIPADRIRLIYSGRVLKDPDTLASCKPAIKDGYTIHMVKGAESNSRQNPASATSSAAAAAPAVPTMAAGTGNNALSGLTGARYAGFHGLPDASMFGADGGMGAPPNADAILRQMEDPNFLSQMNEAMNNPAVIEMMENHPMMRDNPMMRQMIRDPNMRRMMMNPDMIRMQMQMQQHMGGGEGEGAFPAPGVTDTTPQAGGGAEQGNAPPPNPFASLLGGQPGRPGAANPFAALFPGAPMGPSGTTPTTSPPATASAGQGTPSTNTDQAQQNPFASLFGAAPGAGGATSQDPFAQLTQQMMQNPEMMRSAMNMFGGMGGQAPGAGADAGAGANAANPFAGLFGNNPFGGGFPPAAAAPPDNRPPEERYESQLRQLNDMGFFDFDSNVTALRRSGGSVQGAINFLLGDGGA